MIRTKESLQDLLDSQEFVPYIRAEDDPRYPKVSWSVVGDLRYDLLWIILLNVHGEIQFVECIKSPVSSSMRQRIEGIDAADAFAVQNHIDFMWDRYKEEV